MKYAPKVKASRASAIIAVEPLNTFAAATLVSQNPYHDFARALAFFYQLAEAGPPAFIRSLTWPPPRSSARIPQSDRLPLSATHVTIGDNAVLHPHAVIYEGCTIGDNFTAHSHVGGARILPHRKSRHHAKRRRHRR